MEIKDSIVALITPFDEDLNVDYRAFEKTCKMAGCV